jgi:eukaryotic-like serine/threonine-protein kinase
MTNGASAWPLEQRRALLTRFLRMGLTGWTLFVLVDLVAVYAHGAPLFLLLALRFLGTGVGLLIYVHLRSPRATRRSLAMVDAGMFIYACALLSVGTLASGGIASPLAQGVAIVILVRALLPDDWRRALLCALTAVSTFPLAALIAIVFFPDLIAPVDRGGVWTFIETNIFLVLSAGLSAGGSHLHLRAKREVHEARHLGAYRLLAPIGTGGMGEVWLARQYPLDRPVALKLLKERALAEPMAMKNFRREALAASRLVHPNTIRVYDFGASDDGVLFLAMELLDGLDLEQVVMQGGTFSVARAIHVARQACGSLAEAHQAGIVHCDVKPANLFLTRAAGQHDFVKVLDFGLAHITVGPGSSTVLDGIRGTPPFMPPEVIRGERVTPESDVYALGAVLYFMVTGTTVFDTKSFHDSVRAHLEKTPEPPSKRIGHPLAPDFEAVVMRCLAKSRADRYRDARELEAALAACHDASKWTEAHARACWERLRPSAYAQPTA